MNFFKNLWKDEHGQDLVEYALLLVGIALVCITAIGNLGSTVNNMFTSANTSLS